jgi:hypothetical protein
MVVVVAGRARGDGGEQGERRWWSGGGEARGRGLELTVKITSSISKEQKTGGREEGESVCVCDEEGEGTFLRVR